MIWLCGSRRLHAVAVEKNVGAQKATTTAAAVVKRKAAAEPAAVASSTGVVEGEKKEIFWMRDPNTGDWIPESHFGEIDVAEQREKLLPKKHNSL